jgi:hypothetical protein
MYTPVVHVRCGLAQHGIIHNCICQLVLRDLGEEAWVRASDTTQLSKDVNMKKTFSDDDTYRLIGAVANMTGCTVPDLLEAFGIYFVEYVIQNGLGELLACLSDNLRVRSCVCAPTPHCCA